MKSIRAIVLGVAGLSLWAASPAVSLAGPEDVGTSTADLPSLSGMFAISNDTGHTIHYFVRWGDGKWKEITLATSRRQWHSHVLDDNGRAPTPEVRFDGVDHNHKRVTYKMEFFAVGYGGYGPAPDQTQAKEYDFRYSPDGGSLDLYPR